MLRTLAVFIASILVSHLAAADLAITGKWMVSGFTSTTTGMDGKKLGQSTMHIRPGVIAMEIGEKDMTTTVSMIPGQPPQVLQMPYTVQKKSETSMTILLVTPHDKTPKTTVITQEGSGLTLTDDTTTTTVVPYDPAAITAEQKRVEEGNKPADSLTNHSLSGHLNGADWTPIACRRSSFQFDETGKHIRVDVTRSSWTDTFNSLKNLRNSRFGEPSQPEAVARCLGRSIKRRSVKKAFHPLSVDFSRDRKEHARFTRTCLDSGI